MFSTPISDVASVKQVQLGALRTYAALDPSAKAAPDLLEAAVSFKRVQNLYPFEFDRLVEHLNARLTTPQLVCNLLKVSSERIQSGLTLLLDMAPTWALDELWMALADDALAESNANFSQLLARTMADGGEEVVAPDLRMAIMKVADTLWLASNWNLLPEMHHRSSILMTLLNEIRTLLLPIDNLSAVV